jgi:transposase
LTPHHRFLLTEVLSHIDYLDEAISRVSQELSQRLEADEDAVVFLDSIPGVSRRTAEIMLAEVVVDVSRFPSAQHLASWAGMCPGNHESAGKRLSGKTRKGSPWLRQALVEAAHSVGRTDSYLGAQYYRLAARRGKKRAAVAVARSILVIAYHVLKRREPYRELGANYFDKRNRRTVERRLVQRLERLGYAVQLQPVVAEAERPAAVPPLAAA